ncbi:MFS transporter [Paenibacillus doosanensis]|uniref:MFS transporter n=1 Tax=Paenibacillus doosanensis TaxID=1229154 RepID=UPI00217F399A|nr:MFS transporter [Paenibacillus doosanensis]MCS7458944.1 MFS transporter [Paenibacillus doosanensis]
MTQSLADRSVETPPDAASSKPLKEPLWTRSFIVLALGNLLLFFGFQMLLPTIPAYVTQLGGDNSAVGMVIFILTFAALLIRPFSGAALDLMSGRLILIVGSVVTLAAIGSYIAASAVGAIYVLRIVHGFGWGISTTTYGTMASHMIPASRRGEGMGYFGLASTLAMALGPMTGIAIINTFSFTVLFAVSFILTLLSLLVSLFAGRSGRAAAGEARSASASSAPSGPSAQASKQGALLSRLVDKQALFPSLLVLLIAVTYGGIVSFITLFGKEQGIANVGWFFSVNAIMLFLIRPISGKIFDRRGHVWVLAPGAVFSLIGLILLSYASSTALLIAAAAFYGTGFGAIQPSLQAWIIQRAAPERRGAANATFFSAFDLGIGLGALLLGPIAAATNYAVMYRFSAIMFVLYLITYIVYMLRSRKLGQKKSALR